ncbi:hypothetical protein [Beijerinckia sp. L45]|uniref:DUF1254 domain-containing protein n=1 Tax=Beijerinckia sp. L45 TaxID=1641855 RepID=UPI00131D9454|nr:hypothetical protein [Beijerinckia sp. L45]
MNRLIGVLPWLLATLLVAGLTHFTAILILPKVATRDAFDRLAAQGGVDHMVLLPSSGPDGTVIPFLDPATVQGLCFFDVGKTPVRLKARVEAGRLLTLSFRTREGRIFYAMTDRAALHDTIDIRLVTESQLQQVEAGDDEEQGLPSELRLKAPAPKGLIVATALVARPGDRQEAEARIKAIDCRPEPLAAP